MQKFTEEEKREIAKKAIKKQLRMDAVDEYRKQSKGHQLAELLRIVKEANLEGKIKPMPDKEAFVKDYINVRI